MNEFINIFTTLIGVDWKPSLDIVELGNSLKTYSDANGYTVTADYEKVICEAINQKLDTGKKCYRNILDTAFREHIILNYNMKKAIQGYVTSSNVRGYEQFLKAAGISNEELLDAFLPVSHEDSIRALKEDLKTNKKTDDTLNAIFARAYYMLFEKRCCDLFFSGQTIWDEEYEDLLERQYPGFSDREKSLVFVEVDNTRFSDNYVSGANYYFNVIKKSFRELDNYSDLVIVIPPFNEEPGVQWRIYSDFILYAEKHDYHPIDRMYFRYKKVAEATTSYIKSLDVEEAKFELAAEGFVFKDCFVVPIDKAAKEYNLVLILEKNKRDERPVNCPACRSTSVQGNSYPILNVRSWECENPLCPDRSKFNRGKRYSYVSYMRQKALEDERNEISPSSLSKWHLDCTAPMSIEDIFDMACCHYSFVGDTIIVMSQSLKFVDEYKYRIIRHEKVVSEENLYYTFKNSSYFKRYNYDNPFTEDTSIPEFTLSETPRSILMNGDSRLALKKIQSNSISAAVTSPPYYNAKEYSQWDNIYCYLYDMRNIANEVYNVLKPGGVFLYNIFDYFDNEKNIVFSAMGDKRMILGAYIIDLFERIGFKIYSNLIWNKGEIQGNRNFNQGNNTPYYQAPLNCWEHIFVFSKGEIDPKFEDLTSQIKNIKPYIKYVKGKNVLGHDAPFPEDIPNIILHYLTPEDILLDPFSGSYTSGIAAYKCGVAYIGIEMCEEYIELSKKRFSDS